jgi:hypothetical protein
MRKTNNTPRKTTSTSSKTTTTSMVSDYLRTNRNASDSEVYMHILKQNKIPVTKTTISKFFSDYKSYPSFRSVIEISRQVRMSMRPRTTKGTILPTRKKVS